MFFEREDKKMMKAIAVAFVLDLRDHLAWIGENLVWPAIKAVWQGFIAVLKWLFTEALPAITRFFWNLVTDFLRELGRFLSQSTVRRWLARGLLVGVAIYALSLPGVFDAVATLLVVILAVWIMIKGLLGR